MNPLKFTEAEVKEYRAQFQEQVEACPKDSNAQFAMGLTYLGLKNYELADEHFIKAVQLTPSNPDVYYYTALSMFHHRSVMNLSKAEMARIEEWLHTAVQMQPKRKYLILQMILRQGMWSMGMNVDTDKLSPAELMKQARVTTQEEDELQEIEQHVLITDEKTQFLLNKLADGAGSEPTDDNSQTITDILNAYADFCDMPRGDEEDDYSPERVESLEDEDVRRDFFASLHRPSVPVKESKPGFMGPLMRSIWKAVIAFLIWIVCLIIVAACGWFDTFDVHVKTADERMADMSLKGMSKKEKAELHDRLYVAFQEDSIEDTQRNRLLYVYKDEAGERHTAKVSISEEELAALPADTQYFGLRKGWRGVVGILAFILPILIWIISTVIRFISRVQERKEIDASNKAAVEAYDILLEKHLSRPTVTDYKLYCALFAGPNETSVIHSGDFVSEALRQARISEKDIQNGNGKIFFSCYMTDIDNDNNDCRDPWMTLRDVVVRVCVAMRDSIVYMHGVWNSVDGNMPIFDQERLLYSQIANFRNVASYSTLEVISHSNTTLAEIIYGYGDFPSLFQYQDMDPDDEITYSTTRTSDFDEFYNSLIKMHTAYIKS